MPKKSFPLSKVYGLLEPAPVVMVTTTDKMKANIMTMSWYTMMEFEPPMVGCGNSSGRKIDKFKVFGLTQVAASCVKAPLIGECYANLECKVVDGKMVSKYNLFILEVLKAWINPARKDAQTIHHRGRGAFMVAGETIKLPSKKK